MSRGGTEGETDGRRGMQAGMALHAIAKARLRWLTVASRGTVAIAVRLLRRNSDTWACSEHQLGCAWNRCLNKTLKNYKTLNQKKNLPPHGASQLEFT